MMRVIRLIVQRLLRAIQRNAPLLIGIVGVVGVGTFIWASKTMPTTYRGDFQLLVEPVTSEGRYIQPGALTREPGQAASMNLDDSTLDYAIALEILRSPKMLSSIYEPVKKRYPDLTYFSFSKGITIERLTNDKSGEPGKIIKVTFEAKDPKLVEFVLKIAAEQFLKYSHEERKTRIEQGIKFIDDQLPDLNKQVADLQLQLQRLQQQDKLKVAQQYKDVEEQLQIAERTREQLLNQRELLKVEAAQKQGPWERVSNLRTP